MAHARYYAWVAAGRPVRRAPWVVTAKRQAARHGVRWLGDLGNTAHLTASTPEDHTPFSVTAWPVPLPDYVVTAEDFAAGPYCDKILELCRRGDRRVRWIKYMNFRGSHYNVKRAWKRESSSDEHWHISGRSDHTWTDIDPGFDLFDPDMEPAIQGARMKINVIVVNQANGQTGFYGELEGSPLIGIEHGDALAAWRGMVKATGGRETSYGPEFDAWAAYAGQLVVPGSVK